MVGVSATLPTFPTVLRLPFARVLSCLLADTPRPLEPSVTQRDVEAEVANCVGGVVSPLLANVYLHRLDRAWSVREHGVLARFADDLVVMCATRQQAEAALERLRVLLADLGLEPKAAKTRIVHLDVGGEGLDFSASTTDWCARREWWVSVTSRA